MFLRLFGRIAEGVSVVHVVRACRDPTDDKFLELAVNGMADAIVTGENDLLALHPFRAIAVMTPAAFLAPRPPEGDAGRSVYLGPGVRADCYFPISRPVTNLKNHP